MKIKAFSRAALDALSYNFDGKKRPINIMWAVTNRCDGHCAYCRIPARKMRELSTKEALILLDKMIKSGLRRLGIWGGEPLLRQDLPILLRRAKKAGVYVTIDTNGHLIPERYKDIAGMVDHFLVGWDGPAHCIIKGEKAEKETREGIKFLKKMGQKFWIITVITSHNVDRLDEIIEDSKRWNCTVVFQVVHHNSTLGQKGFLPDEKKLRDALKYIYFAKKAGARIGNSEVVLKGLMNWQDYRVIRKRKKGQRCFAGQLFLNIDADGFLYPCSLLIGKEKGIDGSGDFKKAMGTLPKVQCNNCLATCYSEYNKIFSMDINTGIHWIYNLLRA